MVSTLDHPRNRPSFKYHCEMWALSLPWEAFSELLEQFRLALPEMRFPTTQQNITTNIPFKLVARRKDGDCNGIEYHQVSASLLIDLLIRFEASQCEDIKDKVSGVLCVTLECCRVAVPEDYPMDIKNIAVSLLEHHVGHHAKLKGKAAIVCQKALGAFGINTFIIQTRHLGIIAPKT